MKPEQIPLDLPSPVTLGRENYFVSDANALAFRLVEGWRDWPQGKLVIVGDCGAGKTHLATLWAQEVGAEIVAASDVIEKPADQIAQGPIVIEDIEALLGEETAETALFHLHNLSLSEGHALLMTTRTPPNRLDFALPDLASRLGATTLATLDPPDDALLGAILIKLFADRHVSVGPKLLEYAIPRLDRSVMALRRFVDETLRRADLEGRKIGPRLAGDVLAQMTGQAPA